VPKKKENKEETLDEREETEGRCLRGLESNRQQKRRGGEKEYKKAKQKQKRRSGEAKGS
jgi:hypothetical protein